MAKSLAGVAWLTTLHTLARPHLKFVTGVVGPTTPEAHFRSVSRASSRGPRNFDRPFYSPDEVSRTAPLRKIIYRPL